MANPMRDTVQCAKCLHWRAFNFAPLAGECLRLGHGIVQRRAADGCNRGAAVPTQLSLFVDPDSDASARGRVNAQGAGEDCGQR
jgi:hypothetical protein